MKTYSELDSMTIEDLSIEDGRVFCDGLLVPLSTKGLGLSEGPVDLEITFTKTIIYHDGDQYTPDSRERIADITRAALVQDHMTVELPSSTFDDIHDHFHSFIYEE